MDHHVPAAITEGLILRGTDCLTARADGSHRLPDPELLQRANDLNCVLFSMDVDLLVIAPKWRSAGRTFAGIIYAHPLQITIGQAIRDLELMSTILNPDDMRDQLHRIPL